MNKPDFILNLLEFSKNEGFSFLSTSEQFGDGVGYSDKAKREELIADLQRMNDYCDLIGINLGYGSLIRTVIDADNISGETLIGRFAMMHERGRNFQKYAMTLRKSWVWGETKAGTAIQGIVTFSSHKKARECCQNYAEKCKHVWGVGTYPWIVDLEDEEITRFQPMLWMGRLANYPEKLKAGLFKKRS